MKKNDLVLIAATALYSFLFYQQSAGANFAIFNIMLVACLLIKEPFLYKKPKWLFAAVGCLLTAMCIGIYGNTLSVTGNIISLCLLSGMSFSSRSSVLLSILFSAASGILSPFIMLNDLVKKIVTTIENPAKKSHKRFVLLIIPIAVTFIFFAVYRSSNLLFDNLAAKINFDFISWNWLWFTMLGLLLMYAFFYHKRIKKLGDIDDNAPGSLINKEYMPLNLFGRLVIIEDEDFSGRSLLILLNILILVLNALDFNYLFIDHHLPKGVQESEFLHQGVGMLILSIVMAISVVLFYFRGALNFYQKGGNIRYLAYLWLIQNALMLFSTAVKNQDYIHNFGLTHKRIGVYVYLLLTLIGLATTLIKLIKAKTNIYLFRINSLLFYIVLVLSCFFNWDYLITEYNLNHPKNIDKDYLLELSDTNLPLLLTYSYAPGMHIVHAAPYTSTTETVINTKDIMHLEFETSLSYKIYSFLKNRGELDWRSNYMDNNRVYDDLIEKNTYKKIPALSLSRVGIYDISPLTVLNNITELDLSGNVITEIKKLSSFTYLKRLNLADNKIEHINSLENLQQLEYLDVSDNPINDYAPLTKLPNLKLLRVGNKPHTEMETLKKQFSDNVIIIQ